MADALPLPPPLPPLPTQGLPSNPRLRPSRSPPPVPDSDDALSPSVATPVDQPRATSPEPVSPTQPDESSTLTPVRAHYLKKTLIQLQFFREIQGITSSPPNNISTLSFLGPPFSPPPKSATPLDLPFLRFVFRQFIQTFPFLAAAPKDFWPEKVQPFIASLLSRNLFASSSVLEDNPDADQAGTAKLIAKAERNFALFVNYAIKIVEKEEVVRLNQTDLDRLEFLAKKRHARLLKVKDVFEVNIVSVRTVLEKGREFIIRLRRSRQEDVYVSRRYGDFKTLADELRKRYPDELVRPPPSKDRTYVNVPSSSLSRGDSNDSLPMSPSSPTNPASRLAREKNRLTLRAYLHSLMAISAIAASPVMQSFLTSNPTTLTLAELDDAHRREEADKLREDGRKHFAKEVAARVDALRDTVKGFKGDVMGKDGLTHLFAVIKTTDDIRALPPGFQAVIEWGRISLASTVFHHFVAADDASQSLAGLKRIHGLMPYFMLKGALKISNPVGMIRSVLDLFMAQPFGGRSLLQRMFTSSLFEEVKALEEDIQAVKDKVEDPIICEKIRQFVYAPREIQEIYKADADEEKVHIFTAILRSGENPPLSRAQMHRVLRAHRAHAEYMQQRDSLADSDDDDGPQNEDAWLFEDLGILAKLYSRLRDKQQMIELIFEASLYAYTMHCPWLTVSQGVTADLLKDIITIFYSPLAQVYRAASIADSIGDLQNFINDLIRTVESTEELSQEDPRRTVQIFIDLIHRHEQAFYSFVHKVHSKGEGLFTGLMRWIELFLTIIREGLGPPQSLEFLLPHAGEERQGILEEIDAVALYHYKLKIAHESKIRRRFGNASDTSAEDETAQAIVDGFVRDFTYGDLMVGDAQDVAVEDGDSEGSWDESSEYDDTDSDESASSDSQDGPRAPASAGLARTRTMPPPRQAFPGTQTSNGTPPPASVRSTSSRSRLLSTPTPLRKARSMTFGPDVPPARASLDAAPPVPALPRAFAALAINKPLPSNPAPAGRRPPPPSRPAPPPPTDSSRSTSSERSSRRQRYGGHDAVRGPSKSRADKDKTKTRAPEAAKHPELKRIPELLPIFVEMMRPHLRPRNL
ncbi:hypothetical protein OF83DRAFT_1168999 [Amylostereum chailletii]|nr:hypothetical protein OF83DRAFT_1168999 [Amylostereum chailletii]